MRNAARVCPVLNSSLLATVAATGRYWPVQPRVQLAARPIQTTAIARSDSPTLPDLAWPGPVAGRTRPALIVPEHIAAQNSKGPFWPKERSYGSRHYLRYHNRSG